jgi:predicted CXXCH cytochrome family protein
LVFFAAQSCTQTDRYRTLTFFFEGVPDPNAPSREVLAGGEEGLEVQDPLSAARKRSGPEKTLHRPFEERSCGECHNMYQGGKVKTPAGGLCLSCHEDFLDERLFVHGPVAVNACLRCHFPHESTLPYLLKGDVEFLCLACHAESDLAGSEYHEDLGESVDGCIRCHDPHGGDNNLFLLPPDQPRTATLETSIPELGE